MIKKVKVLWGKFVMAGTQRKQLKNAKKYYTMIKEGAEFIKWIQRDLANRQNKVNRHERRRMQKSLIKGEITPEIVNYYQSQIDNILVYINRQLNPPKPGQVKIDKQKMLEGIQKHKETK